MLLVLQNGADKIVEKLETHFIYSRIICRNHVWNSKI